MLQKSVRIYKNKLDNGTNRMTFVVDNGDPKVLDFIAATITSNKPITELTSFVNAAPSKEEAKAIEAMDTDTSGMEEVYIPSDDTESATPVEDTAAVIAQQYWDAFYDGNIIEFVKKAVNNCINAAQMQDESTEKAMYYCVDRLLQGELTMPTMQNILYFAGYTPLYGELFKAVAEQKGILYTGANDLATVIGSLSQDELVYIAQTAEERF